MIREMTVVLLVLDDDSCWIRDAGTMRLLEGITGDQLGAGDGGSVAAMERRKRAFTRHAPAKKAKQAKATKIGGGASRVPPVTPKLGRDDVDWAALELRVRGGERISAIAADTGVNAQRLYSRAKKWKTKAVAAMPRKCQAPAATESAPSAPMRRCPNCRQLTTHDPCQHCFEAFPK